MEILSLDIEGKFAHFRKFHGNNTAISYSIPPRTTIIGMLAAVLGEPKDSYYESFRHKNINIGIRVLSDIKKSFHRLNYLSIKGLGDFNGRNGRIQTPFEIVTPHDLKTGMVKYRIYLSAGEDHNVYERLKKALTASERTFNLSLGIAGFAAFVSDVSVHDAYEYSAVEEWVEIHSACNSGQVREINLSDTLSSQLNKIEEELMPADFVGGNKGREVYRMNRILFASSNFPIKVLLRGNYFSLSSEEPLENIQFLEYAGIFA